MDGGEMRGKGRKKKFQIRNGTTNFSCGKIDNITRDLRLIVSKMPL